MKVREGFVSNSSSTSFVVAIPLNVSKEEQPLIDIFEKIVDKLKAENSHFGGGFVLVEDMLKDYDERINDLVTEREHYQYFYNQVSEFMRNKASQAAVQLFLDIVRKSEAFAYLKYGSTPTKQMSELQHDTQEQIKKINEDIEKLKKERQQVIDNGMDSKYIMSFKLDHWCSDVEKVLEIMIEKGIVRLVRKVST